MAQVAQINALEPSIRAMTDADLAEQTLRFRAALERNTHRCGGWAVKAPAAEAPLARVCTAAGVQECLGPKTVLPNSTS